MPIAEFLPIRACLFDMDGLLLDTEDIASQCHSLVLAKYGRPPLPPHIKAQMMGRNGVTARKILLDWAGLTLTDEEYRTEVSKFQKELFPAAKPLPGVEDLLNKIDGTKFGDQPVHLALASSCSTSTFTAKTSKLQEMFTVFSEDRRILGDSPLVPKGRGKPFGDIYEIALKSINDSLSPDEKPITPAECLVFEDSVSGVEAGRRAGMRVIWCPLQCLADAYAGQEPEVLAGLTGGATIDMHQCGEVGDGWGEQIANLVDFPLEKYGIVVSQAEVKGSRQVNAYKEVNELKQLNGLKEVNSYKEVIVCGCKEINGCGGINGCKPILSCA